MDRQHPQNRQYYHHNPHRTNGSVSSNNSNSSSYSTLPGSSSHNYAATGYNHHHGYLPPRPESVPPPDSRGDLSSDSLYAPRPGSVPPHYFSDSETGGGAYRGPTPETSVYGTMGRRPARNYESDSGYGTRSSGRSSGLRVHPDDERYRAAPGRRPVPRRHTVTAGSHHQQGPASSRDPETERKREAFMQLLAQRYPQYADKISGKAPPEARQQQGTLEKPARSRDSQRRRTAVVTYDPSQASNTLEYDDLGTMSDLELPSFQRGGFTRTSLPIVRSGSTSLERPLGLVFLVFGDQTKKSLLPNEITTLDTVRALFVRAFPDLTLEMLERPRRKIYILDPATSIYFQLEDLAEIKDRSVLKIHETDNDEPQKVKERQEVRGRTVQMPSSRPHSRQGYGEVPAGHMDTYSKSQSLPQQAAQVYPEMMAEHRNHWEMERRSRSRTPEATGRERSLSAGSAKQRFSHSPDRLPTPERGPHLNPIPENRQLPPGYREQPTGIYDTAYRVGGGGGGSYQNAIYDVAPASYQGYAPVAQAPQGQPYVARSTRAPPMAHAQRAVGPGPGQDMRESGPRGGSNRHSLAFAPMSPSPAPSTDSGGGFQRSQSYRLPPTERDLVELARSHSSVKPNETTRNRIEKMEAQLATLTAWVHTQKGDQPTHRDVPPPPRSLGSCTSDSSDTFPASSASKDKGENAPVSTFATTNSIVPPKGLSSDMPDGAYLLHQQRRSSGEATPVGGQAEVMARLALLKNDLHVLRRQQQLNMEAMRDEILTTFTTIKGVLSSVPGAEHQVNVHKRTEATEVKKKYLNEKEQVDKELGDLEASVEELRTDVISRQCRVNIADVEGMALLLSNATKNLADLKARFPEIHGQMKQVMDSELRVVVSEEKFLKDEPTEIENSLKRCKKLTSTLYTLKRLASVQDNRPPHVPNLAAPTEDSDDDPKMAVLENIRALVPDHDQRVQQMEAADAARERKKKISTQQEALKFGKSLEMASKNLRPPSAAGDKISDVGPEAPIAQAPSTQPTVSKPAVPSKPLSLTSHITNVSSSSSHSSASSTVSLPTSSTATLTTAVSPTTTLPSVSSSKPSFTASLSSSGKTIDKPTATVSAMTNTNTPATNTVSTIAPSQSVIKTAPSLPLTDTTGRLSSNVHSGTGAVTNTVKTANQKSEVPVPTSSPISPTSPVKRPVFTKPAHMGISSTNKSPTKASVTWDKSVDINCKNNNINKQSAVSKVEVCQSSEAPVISTSVTQTQTQPNGDIRATQKKVNGHSEESVEKVDLHAQKQAARSAFFSSMNSPPTSPTMSGRNSALLDPGPVVRPGPNAKITTGGMATKVTPGPTINLVLSGCVQPKSPTSPGSFTISPPKELASPPPHTPTTATGTVNKQVTSPPSTPLHNATLQEKSDKDTPPSTASSSSSIEKIGDNSEVTMRNKKVPPPPPPRKGSRPTSANMSPVNGPGSRPQSEETTPRFVGGVLGQHRLSGGPLSSTPKPVSQQNPFSKFEKDIASGIYSNLNRPEFQSQRSTPQQILTEAKTSSDQRKDNRSSDTQEVKRASKTSNNEYPVPPPPHITMALDREERGSSSESTSSSSGTSMGSQQSVVSVVRSVSSAQSPPNKPKPDPPRRHSSLLAKFTGTRDSKPTMNNGNANVNGVDL